MAKEKEFLEVTRLALANGFLNACVQGCYYAMFWATVAMLEWTGQKRVERSHGELGRYFGLVSVKQWHLCPDIWGEWLQEAHELRVEAAYKREVKNQAQRTLRYAEAFVLKAEEARK